MATNGVYVKPAPIGSAVVTTDDVIAQGYDFLPLKMGGMLKVQEATVDGDLTIKGDAAYVPPKPLGFSTDLTATKSVATGAALTLTVAAKDGFGDYTYQWYKDGAPLSGRTSASFSKSAAEAGDAGVYYCEVTDKNGDKAQSKQCTVTVTA
jgi:hypothetical protein